jgi:hypothetical protein
MESIRQMTLEYQESTAFHEAAHEVICIAQDIPIRELGLRIDSKGHGVSHTYRRNAGNPDNTETDVRERKESIILLFAGYWGQVRIFPDLERAAIAHDQSQIDALLDEMHLHESAEWYAAKDRLRDESERLVAEHWPAIDAVATALWGKPWKNREELPQAEMGWSDDRIEKSLNAKEVEAIVRPFGLNPMIRPDSAGSYTRT